MQPTNFSDRDLEILILALRYWRVQRGLMARRTDPVFRPNEIDLLLAKLQSSRRDLLSSVHGDSY
jgi:hypothetical protein